MNNPFDTTNPWSNQTRGTSFNNQYNDPYRQTQVYTGFNNFQRPQSNIPGRLVNNLDEITPQEVPMDGSVSLFPQNDYSAIYAKTWTKDGTIATVKYVPEPNQTAPQKTSLETRLDKIDQRFDKLERMLTRNNKPYRKHQPVKKEEPIDG